MVRRPRIVPLAGLLLLAGCTSQVGTLSIGVTRSADTAREPLAGRVSTVRVRVDGPGVRMQVEVPFDAHQVVLKDIPVGEDRQVTVEGIAAGSVVSKGSSCPVSVTAGESELSVFVALFGKNGEFSLAPGVMNQARAYHTATLLADGCSVLLAGGTKDYWQPESDQPLPSALFSSDRLDGSSALIEPGRARCVQGGEPGCMWQKRIGHSATLLPGGNVLVAGGSNGAAATNNCELYEPGSGNFEKSADTRYSQIWHQAALVGSKVAMLGGVNYLGELVDTAQAWEDGSVGVAFPALQTPRRAFTLTKLADGTLFAAGGYDTDGKLIASTELLGPGWPSWGRGPKLNAARAHHTATLLPDGTVLVTGGVVEGDQATGTLEICNKSLQTCVPAGGAVNLKTPRWKHTATLLSDGRVLVVGGFGGNLSGAPIAFVEAIGASVGNVVQLGNLHDRRAGHTATRVGNGTVVVAGGTDGSTALDSVEIFVY